MISKISEGILISVETFYQPEYSNPLNNEFTFSYHITIENNNKFPVQLLQRYWYIYESTAQMREVEGEGVVGVQPVIQPGKLFEYSSACNLRTEIGRMHGEYLMQNLNNRLFFRVKIPAFEMIVPFKNN